MLENLHYCLKLLLTQIIVFGVVGNMNAYHPEAVSKSNEDQLITEILKEISERYQVFFAYQNALVENIRIDFEIRKEEALESVVQRLMQKTNLKFELVGEKFCILYSNYDKQSLRHKKKIKKRILQIEKLEKEGHTTLISSSANNAIKLRSIMEVTAPVIPEIEITGTVTDEDGAPLIGANILVKGTSIGTVTDLDGKYSLSVPDDATTLVFSYTGYSTQEVLISGRTTVDVSLQEGVGLEEVVVVGYGTQRKENLTGAVASVGPREIEARPITSVAQALQGTTAGVFINQNSGQPGRDNVLIRIRGVGTLNNANPLILVDGIEAPLNNINPSDIESITVLKDAASAAIYGSRAANGVVLVTTKRGRAEEKPTFTYDGYVGTSDATLLPEMVIDPIEFANLRNESLENFGLEPHFTEERIAILQQNRENFTVDWLDEVFRSAPIQQHTLGVGGGSENTNFRFSLGYLDQEGVILGSDFERYNARLNLDTEVSPKFKMGTSISYIRGDRNSSSDDLGNLSSVLTHTIQKSPESPAFWNGRETTSHPNTEVKASNFNFNDEHILANAYLQWRPIEGLTLKGTGAINSQNLKLNAFNQSVLAYDWMREEEVLVRPMRSATNRHERTFNYTLWFTAQYEKSFGNQDLTILAGYNEEESDFERFEAFRNGHLSNSVKVLSAGLASSSTNSGSATTWGLRSYFGRINYVIDDKYLLEGNVRYDGSSRFLEDKWGVFPSVSAGWVISKEDFFQNVASIDFLKLRASWGQLGNQNIGDFAFQRALSLSQAYSFSGEVVPGVAQTSLGNPALSWEAATMTNIGVDVGLFNDLSLEADYFVRKTTDILFDLTISALTGFRTQISNAAEVQNTGWEVNLNYDRSFGKVDFSFGGNLTHVENEVLTINPNIEIGDLDEVISGRRILKRGAPLGAFWGVKQIGIFQSQAEVDAAPDHSGLNPNFGPGDLRFEDLNGDGVVDVDDRTVIGKENPTWTYGFNFRVGYGGFDLAAIFQGAADFDAYGSEELSDPFFNFSGLPARWRDRWTPDNPDAALPRLYFSNGPSNSITNSFFVYDRSYFRLKNLQIGYQIPQRLLDNIGFSRARFYLNGSNIFTITDFPFFDPERPSGADRGATGVPMIRVFSAGVSLAF